MKAELFKADPSHSPSPIARSVFNDLKPGNPAHGEKRRKIPKLGGEKEKRDREAEAIWQEGVCVCVHGVKINRR